MDVACWRFVAELHLELIRECREDLVLALSDLLNHVAILTDVLNLNNRVFDVWIECLLRTAVVCLFVRLCVCVIVCLCVCACLRVCVCGCV